MQCLQKNRIHPAPCQLPHSHTDGSEASWEVTAWCTLHSLWEQLEVQLTMELPCMEEQPSFIPSWIVCLVALGCAVPLSSETWQAVLSCFIELFFRERQRFYFFFLRGGVEEKSFAIHNLVPNWEEQSFPGKDESPFGMKFSGFHCFWFFAWLFRVCWAYAALPKFTGIQRLRTPGSHTFLV